jgi:predicted RNase H-like HicB family nuclease
MLTLTAVVHKEEDMYVAECPEVETASQGKTVEEAVKISKRPPSSIWKNFP